MSDYEDSTITYIAVSSPFGGLLDIGSPGVGGPPVMPEDPYAYVVAAFQYLPSLDYRMIYFSLLPAAASPTTESPGYIDESNPEDDPVEDLEEDFEEDPTDYPADRRDEGDDEDKSSNDDEDDDIDIMRDEEEDEYLAPAESTTVALPAIDHAPSAEETEPFETDEAARLRLRVEREEIPEADLPLRKRLCTTHTGTYELGESFAAAAARLKEPVRDDLYRFVDTVKRVEGSTPAAMEVGYGITETWDDLVGAIQETAPTTVEEVNKRVTELSTTFNRETSMIYAMIEEKKDDQALQRARVN
nr:hypothetical protein [Tanacetum cinerariifolium]